jgi:hypothetical protein
VQKQNKERNTMPEIPEDIKKLIEAAVTQAKIDFENHSKEKMTAFKETVANQIDKLKESHSAEVAAVKDDLTNANAKLATFEEQELNKAIERLKKHKPDYDPEKYNTVEKINSFCDIVEEAIETVNADKEEEHSNAPAQTGGNTKPPIEGHSGKKTYRSRYDQAKKDLYDGINR